MDGAGLVDACGAIVMAAAALYHLFIHQFADEMPSGKRRLRGALIIATLCYASWLLAGICDRASRDHLASRLEETEAKRWPVEEITMDDYKKQNLEMMNNLVDMLSKNPASIKSMISYKVQGSDDGTDNVKTTELSVTMKYDGHVHLPYGHHLDEAPTKVSDGTTTTTVEENRWTARVFSLPPEHALFLDCVGGELTVHVQHQRYTGSGETCRSAAAAPYLYESGLERTLFLARRGEEEHAGVPELWPPRDESSPVLVEIIRAVPEPIALTADVVVHYRTLNDGMIFLTVAPRNALGYNATATATRLSSEGSDDAIQHPLELNTRLHQASLSDSNSAALLLGIVSLVAVVLWTFFIGIYMYFY